MTKTILFLFTLILGLGAAADTVDVPKEVFSELQKFSDDGQTLPASYIQNFPARLHESILQREQSFFNALKGQCQDSLTVSFGPSVMGTSGIEKSFESGLIRIEASKCFDNASPEDLLQISNSVEFKRRAFSTLRQITVQDNRLYCETTEAPTVGKSNYCYLDFQLEKNETASSHVNFLTFNNEARQFDAPVYFRESLQTSRRMDSKTLFYTLSYVRATTLSGIKSFFAKSYIGRSQTNFFKELESSLNKNKSH